MCRVCSRGAAAGRRPGSRGGTTGSPPAPPPVHPFPQGHRLLLFPFPSAQRREGKREQEDTPVLPRCPSISFSSPPAPETLCPASAWRTEVSGHFLSKQFSSGPCSTKQTSVFFGWKKMLARQKHTHTVKAEDATDPSTVGVPPFPR